jgi:quinol-cytochrome oxidoreductase complex cytochrome b subunit/cytochrome c551/c552
MKRFSSFGKALLLLVLVAIVTGIILLPFYRATAAEAYQSVAIIQASAPLRIIRAAHHWSSALLILLGGLYLIHSLFSAAYRQPLHLAWVAVVGMVLLFLAFQLTGHLLPWDSQAVSTAAIETGVAENVPVVGPMQARVVRGGTDSVSPQTLAAWYVAHVALFPIALAACVALFLTQLRRVGTRLSFSWTAALVLPIVLLLIGAGVPAGHGPPATPADYHSFTAQSEWYVLPLHGLLVIAQSINPKLAFLGTVVLPGLVVLLLLALPWLDRKTVNEPPSGLVRGITVVGLAGVLTLMQTHMGSMAPLLGPEGGESPTAEAAHPAATKPLDPALVAKGKTVVNQNGCIGCHKVGSTGGTVGPPLDGTGSRHPDPDWQVKHLQDPPSVTKGSTMPAYKQLSPADLKALATYLLSLK